MRALGRLGFAEEILMLQPATSIVQRRFARKNILQLFTVKLTAASVTFRLRNPHAYVTLLRTQTNGTDILIVTSAKYSSLVSSTLTEFRPIVLLAFAILKKP